MFLLAQKWNALFTGAILGINVLIILTATVLSLVALMAYAPNLSQVADAAAEDTSIPDGVMADVVPVPDEVPDNICSTGPNPLLLLLQYQLYRG